MGAGHDDGVYVSGRRKVQRRKKAAVALAGLAAVVGGGAWGVWAWQTAQSALPGDSTAIAPAVTPSLPDRSSDAQADEVPPLSESPSPSPSARSSAPRLSGVPQARRPSPTPTPDVQADDEIAAAQVSRLLSAPRATSSGPRGAAGEAITVTNEPGADGSAIRVVAARYDLTAGGSQLSAADTGHPINGARCTQNLRFEGTIQVRPGLMLCWRTSSDRSVVTIATSATGRPAAAEAAAVIDRIWRTLE